MKPFRPLLGRIQVLLVFANGPTPATLFSDAERAEVVATLRVGLGLLRQAGRDWASANNAAAPCDFHLDSHVPPRLATPPATKARPVVKDPATGHDMPAASGWDDLSRPWFDELLTALGVPAGVSPTTRADVQARLDALTTLGGMGSFGLKAADAVPVIVTKYPSYWYGYAEGDLAPVVQWSDPVIQALGQADRAAAFAHELGHVFLAPDEYDVSGCTTFDIAGQRDQDVNANCTFTSRNPRTANNTHVSCLMDKASPLICSATTEQWGWFDDSGSGTADLAEAPTLTTYVRAAGPGVSIQITGTNLWDVDTVAFGGDVSPRVQYTIPGSANSPLLQAELTRVLLPATPGVTARPLPRYSTDTILAEVPNGAPGVIQLDVSTRVGNVGGLLADTWFVRLPLGESPPHGLSTPEIFGMLPSIGTGLTPVQLFGVNLTGVQGVNFVDASGQATPAAGLVEHPTFLELTAPALGISGLVQVIVTTALGSSTQWLGSIFTYT